MLNRPSLVLGVDNSLVEDSELRKLAFLVKYRLDRDYLRMPNSHVGCHAHLNSLHVRVRVTHSKGNHFNYVLIEHHNDHCLTGG
jgi:hypothetical protein